MSDLNNQPRTSFSFQNTITGIEQSKEVYALWSECLEALRPHLINKLIKRNMEPILGIEYMKTHANKHDSLLQELLIEVMTETPDYNLEIHRLPTMDLIESKKVIGFINCETGQHVRWAD